jgi:hypothetical protein
LAAFWLASVVLKIGNARETMMPKIEITINISNKLKPECGLAFDWLLLIVIGILNMVIKYERCRVSQIQNS